MSDAKRELEALWLALFHEPPVVDADPALLAHIITRCTPAPPPYVFGPDGAAPGPTGPLS